VGGGGRVVAGRGGPGLRTALVAAALFLLGVGVDLHFGRQGFLPLDQSISFDGGWRVMNGQLPFRDFTTPNGVVPLLMQVPFFRLLGVTWFAMCLHAAVVNGVACVAVFAFLRLCGSTLWQAAAFGALNAVFFYPPTGTPFSDQHSFFFTLLMFVAVALGTVSPNRALATVAWFLVPALFLLGFLSCQIPTAFAALCVAAWVVVNPRRAVGWIVPIAAGTCAVAVVLLLIAALGHVDLRSAFDHMVLSPIHQGGSRTPTPGLLSPVRMVLGTIRRLPAWAQLWSLDAALVSLLFLPFVARRSRIWRLHAWALVSLVATTGAFVAYSKTQIDTGLALAMLIAGVGAVVLAHAVEGIEVGDTARQRLRVIGAVVVLALATRDAIRFTRQVDVPGTVHKHYDAQQAIAAAGKLPPAMSFMRWSRGASQYEPEEFAALVRYLHDADGDFLLIGDSSILYGLTGRVSPSPVLFFDFGLTVPRSESPGFALFETDLIARMRNFGVRRVVLEGSSTWGGLSLGALPTVKRWTVEQGCGERAFGGVRVLEMCSPR